MGRFLIIALFLLQFSTMAGSAQTVNVTFRYIPGEENVVRAFVPGDFNNWGPDSSGTIAINAASLMTYVDTLDQWIHAKLLQAGQTYDYKIHIHQDEAGSNVAWLTDPLNPVTNPAGNNNSVLEVRDPMVFQPAHETSAEDLITAVSATLIDSQAITQIQFWVNGIEHDGMPYFNAGNGVFRYQLERPVKAGSQFKIKFMDQVGRADSVEIGKILSPVSWKHSGFKTVMSQQTISAFITRQDGTVDPALAEAMLITPVQSVNVSVVNGEVSELVDLEIGDNTFLLEASIEGNTFTSDSLIVHRRLHPLETALIEAETIVTGDAFTITVSQTALAPADLSVEIRYDEIASSGNVGDFSTDGFTATGRATLHGDLYFNITASSNGEQVDKMRMGMKVDKSNQVRPMAYEDTPAWVNNAVVYEIFPLSFGQEASGTESAPGNRFKEITGNLEYIADMGFNTIWFMPIMKNQFMDQLSGGYNIIDFYNVDPRLGTNEDFQALVESAHDFDIKVILDLTPNHSSPAHPWVDALKQHGSSIPPGSFLQVEPSSHNRGLDNMGPNLSEIWQVSDGGNLYRKYDGFGDLANVNWDNDDLQAEFLDIIAYWVNEFDIDGWRFDVYWGPWRRYGPERFGRPIRQLMKRIKPDSWILGEIAGTGFTTEVYYADDDFGTQVVGGIDAGYDWNFYFNGIRGTFGNISNYDEQARNGNFWPGPNARFFRFLENHDEERIAKRLSSNPYQILPLTGFLITTTGIPMIYQGQEVNFGDVAGDERRVSVNWNTNFNGKFGRYHQQLAQARSQFPAFGTQEIETISTSNSVYAFVRPYLDENALVMINFSGESKSVTLDPSPVIDMTTDGPIAYTHLFADSTFIDEELDGFSATLAPYETAVFIANNGENVVFELPELPSLPFGAVYTGIADLVDVGDLVFELYPNYPNPFSERTTISFAVPKAGRVKLQVFDVLGRKVGTLLDESGLKGRYDVGFNARNLPAGVYFVHLEAGGKRATQQMVLVR